MKKNILSVIAILIIAAAAVGVIAGVIYCTTKNAKLCEQENLAESGLSMNVSSVHQTDSFYNIQVEYPQFKNTDSAFNKKIADLINGQIDSFKKQSKDNWEARRATAPTESPLPETPEQPFDFIATWEPTQLNENYISFVLNVYYFVGGAHGATEVHGFNYDLKKQKEITILDFLNSLQPALDKLATLAAENVTSQMQRNEVQLDDFLQQMIQEGTKPTSENYQDFNFNCNSLIIYFQQYQVAPGAVGSVNVTFYKNTLDTNSIKSDYLK
jgi:hypothetical protein